MLQGLQAILEKNPVVPTVNAEDILTNPQTVEDNYLRHVNTYIPMGDVSQYAERLTRKTEAAVTPKGLLVAPYGYGKTSTAAFLWHECEDSGLVATPPFYCSNLLDILKATYGWVKYRLQRTEPHLTEKLDAAYSKYTEATVEEMAKRYARQHGIATVTANNLLNEMLQDGSLVLELTPSNLLFFLDATTTIVIQAGFTGLAILPDEFQQYFSKGAHLRRTIQEFREFVWGLDTRASALGVIISMPTYAEAIIQEQGKDILHRLKNDGFYYRLQDIYTVDFPSRLWERYVDTFELKEISSQVVEGSTLRAIGQIAEREDLGEGPRTVIDSFKRAILHYNDHQAAYTPLTLIDDFLESNINFQAQTNKLKTVTRQALDSSIVDTDEKAQAVKLLAAFPRGCPVHVQKQYSLYEAVNSLSKQAHGELMTHRVEGYTLLGLSPTGGPTRTVDLIITRFWRSYEEDELHVEAAARAYRDHLLPRFFETRRGTSATGWGNLEFVARSRGSYSSLIEGTFNPQYPKRRVHLQVAQDSGQLQQIPQEADIQLSFLLSSDNHDATGTLVVRSNREAQFALNLSQRVGPNLPEDLKKLQDFVNPEFVTPLLMLSLIDYFDRWEDITEQPIPETDRAEIEYFVGRLLDHSIQVLLNRDLTAGLTPPLRRVGRLMLEELFNRLCAQLYSDYHTFYNHAQYDKVLNSYINALKGWTLKQRRGHSVVKSTKESLARDFGLTSVATFENRIDSEYAHLVEKVKWTGRGDQADAEIRLKLHPLEREILDAVRTRGKQREADGQSVLALDSEKVASLGRELGYRDEEILLSLQLLGARGYTRFDRVNKLVYLAQVGPDPQELEEQLEELSEHLDSAGDLLSTADIAQFKEKLNHLLTRLDKVGENEEELDELETQISDLTRQLENLLTDQRTSLRKKLDEALLEVERSKVRLRHNPTLTETITGQVAFVMHLNELRQRLADKHRTILQGYENTKQTINSTIKGAEGGPITEVQQLSQGYSAVTQRYDELQKQQAQLETEVEQLKQWTALLRQTETLFNALSRMPELRRQLTDELIPEVQAHLTKRGLEGLSDWEPFNAKVGAVEEELERRRRHGNDVFGEVKDKYESFLREIQVRDYRPRSRYTYGEDEGSYQDLYEEVRAKISGRLEEIAQDLEREQTDLLKAQHITFVSPENRAILEKASNQLDSAEQALQELHHALTIPLIRQSNSELQQFGERINSLAFQVESIRKELGPILFASHELTEDESRVLTALGTRTEMEVTDLFVDLHRDGKDMMDLTQLLKLLESLYRKHRLSIRIKSRG